MRTRTGMDRKKLPFGAATVLGVAAAIVISIICALVISLLVMNGHMSEGTITYFACGTQLLSALLGTLIAGKAVGEKYALVCGVTALIYCFILVAAAILCFDSAFGNAAFGIFMMLIGCAASCLICTRQGGRKTRRKVYSR